MPRDRSKKVISPGMIGIENLFEKEKENSEDFYRQQKLNYFLNYYQYVLQNNLASGATREACENVTFLLRDIIYFRKYTKQSFNAATAKERLDSIKKKLNRLMELKDSIETDAERDIFAKKLLQSAYEYGKRSVEQRLHTIEKEQHNSNLIEYFHAEASTNYQKVPAHETGSTNYKKIPSVEIAQITELTSEEESSGPVLNLDAPEFVNALHIGQELGRGAFGVNYLCKVDEPLLTELIKRQLCSENDNTIVLKKILNSAPTPDEIDNIVKEGNLGDKLRRAYIASKEPHPPYNLTTLVNLNGSPAILSRFEKNGKVLKHINKLIQNTGSQDTSDTIGITLGSMFIDLVQGVRKLQNANLLHQDMAARNILIDASGHAHIADYGLTVAMDENKEAFIEEDTGPLKWMDVTRIRDKKATRCSDFYGLRVAMWEMLAKTTGHKKSLVSFHNNSGLNIATQMVSKGESYIMEIFCDELYKKVKDSESGPNKQVKILLDAFRPFLVKDNSLNSESINQRLVLLYFRFMNGCTELAKQIPEFQQPLFESDIYNQLGNAIFQLSMEDALHTNSESFFDNVNALVQYGIEIQEPRLAQAFEACKAWVMEPDSNEKKELARQACSSALSLSPPSHETAQTESVALPPQITSSTLPTVLDYNATFAEKSDQEKTTLLGKQFLSIMQNVKAMHDSGWLHLDIAGRNIVVDANGQLLFKKSDFEMKIEDAAQHEKDHGVHYPIKWMDSMRIAEQKATPASDLYSLKIAMLEMMGASHGVSWETITNYNDMEPGQIASEIINSGEGVILNGYKNNLEKELQSSPEMLAFYDCFKDFISAGALATNNTEEQIKLDYANFKKGCEKFAALNQEFKDEAIKIGIIRNKEQEQQITQTNIDAIYSEIDTFNKQIKNLIAHFYNEDGTLKAGAAFVSDNSLNNRAFTQSEKILLNYLLEPYHELLTYHFPEKRTDNKENLEQIGNFLQTHPNYIKALSICTQHRSTFDAFEQSVLGFKPVNLDGHQIPVKNLASSSSDFLSKIHSHLSTIMEYTDPDDKIAMSAVKKAEIITSQSNRLVNLPVNIPVIFGPKAESTDILKRFAADIRQKQNKEIEKFADDAKKKIGLTYNAVNAHIPTIELIENIRKYGIERKNTVTDVNEADHIIQLFNTLAKQNVYDALFYVVEKLNSPELTTHRLSIDRKTGLADNLRKIRKPLLQICLHDIEEQMKNNHACYAELQKLLSHPDTRNLIYSDHAITATFSRLYEKSADILANSLIATDKKLFEKIDNYEFYRDWNKVPSPTISVSIEHFNSISHFIITDILSREYADKKRTIDERTLAVEHWIRVAEKCLNHPTLNDFGMVYAIASALNSSPINRLKATFEGLSEYGKHALEQIEEFISTKGSSKNYRLYFEKNPNSIPYLGLHLTDITFFKDGNPVDAKENSLLYKYLANFQNHIKQVKENDFDFNPSEQFVLRSPFDESKVFKKSLELEPRDVETKPSEIITKSLYAAPKEKVLERRSVSLSSLDIAKPKKIIAILDKNSIGFLPYLKSVENLDASIINDNKEDPKPEQVTYSTSIPEIDAELKSKIAAKAIEFKKYPIKLFTLMHYDKEMELSDIPKSKFAKILDDLEHIAGKNFENHHEFETYFNEHYSQDIFDQDFRKFEAFLAQKMLAEAILAEHNTKNPDHPLAIDDTFILDDYAHRLFAGEKSAFYQSKAFIEEPALKKVLASIYQLLNHPDYFKVSEAIVDNEERKKKSILCNHRLELIKAFISELKGNDLDIFIKFIESNDPTIPDKKVSILQSLPKEIGNFILAIQKPGIIPQVEFQELLHHVQTEKPSATVIAAPSVTFQPERINDHLDSIRNHIKLLQEDSLHLYKSHDHEFLVKYNVGNQLDPSNPIHPREAEIQAFRYLQGMLLIAQSAEKGTTNHLVSQIQTAYNNYIKRINDGFIDTTINTHIMAEKFAEILSEQFHVDMKHARKQVTMGRDLGIMLEKHRSICTISQIDNRITIEQAALIQIGPEYYKKYFTQIDAQPWLKHAKKLAGFKTDQSTPWLESFFVNNFDQLQNLGAPAASSARWLPLPANNQEVQTYVANADDIEHGISNNFIRIGIVTSYNIQNDEALQLELAKAQLKEIITRTIKSQLDQFKETYKDLFDNHVLNQKNFDFYVDYQTLLSPWILEYLGKHKDNNGRFVKMAKEAVDSIAPELTSTYKTLGINLHFYQTNTSINKWAGTNLLDNKLIAIYESDNQSRLAKIQATENLVNHALNTNIQIATASKDSLEEIIEKLEKGTYPDLNKNIQAELALRIRAAFYLQQVIDNKAPYKALPAYSRNLAMSALEHLCMGKQTLTLAGCKSARDRTAIFAATIKTMMENPKTMTDWEMLNEGIIKSLIQGQHFRAMLWHSAVAKVSAVHSKIIKQLPFETQIKIASLKRFSKALEEYEPYQKDIDKKIEKILEKQRKHEKIKEAVELPDIELSDEALFNEEKPVLNKADVPESTLDMPIQHEAAPNTSEQPEVEIENKETISSAIVTETKAEEVKEPTEEASAKKDNALKIIDEFYETESAFRDDMKQFSAFYLTNKKLNADENGRAPFLEPGVTLSPKERGKLESLLIPFTNLTENPYGAQPLDKQTALQNIVGTLENELNVLLNNAKPIIINYNEYNEFAAYVKSLGGFTLVDNIRNLSFNDFTSKVYQRITKYPLLLREIIKATPASDPSYGSLIRLLDKVDDKIKEINAARGEYESKLDMDAKGLRFSKMDSLTKEITKEIFFLKDYQDQQSDQDRINLIEKIRNNLSQRPSHEEKLAYLKTVLDPKSDGYEKEIDRHLDIRHRGDTTLRTDLTRLTSLLRKAKSTAFIYKNQFNDTMLHFDHEPSIIELRDRLANERHDMNQYVFQGKKSGGKNDPGVFGGWYMIPYAVTENGKIVQKEQIVLFKQDTHADNVKNNKNIAEFFSGNIMNRLIQHRAAPIFLATRPISLGEPSLQNPAKPGEPIPDKDGTNIYVGSVGYKNYLDLFKVLGFFERPYAVGSFNKEKFMHGFCKTNAKGDFKYDDDGRLECSFSNFEAVTIASLIVGDFDVHTGNYGVVVHDIDKDYIQERLQTVWDDLGLNAEYRNADLIFAIASGNLSALSLEQLKNFAADTKELDIAQIEANKDDDESLETAIAKQIKYFLIRKGLIEAELVKIDHGGACRKLTPDVHIHSQKQHMLVGLEPLNHIREFPRDLKINPEFANELLRQAKIILDPENNFNQTIEDTMREIARYYGSEPILEFARNLASDFDIDKLLIASLKNKYPHTDLSRGMVNIDEQIIKQEVLNLTENFLKERIKDRGESLEKLANEIKLSLCVKKDDRDNFIVDADGFHEFLKQSPDYLLKGDFHFRGSEQRTAIGFFKTKVFVQDRLTQIVTRELSTAENIAILANMAMEKVKHDNDFSMLNTILSHKELMSNREIAMPALAANVSNVAALRIESAIFSTDAKYSANRKNYIELWMGAISANAIYAIDRILTNNELMKNSKEMIAIMANGISTNKSLYIDLSKTIQNKLLNEHDSERQAHYIELWINSTLSFVKQDQWRDQVDSINNVANFLSTHQEHLHNYIKKYGKNSIIEFNKLITKNGTTNTLITILDQVINMIKDVSRVHETKLVETADKPLEIDYKQMEARTKHDTLMKELESTRFVDEDVTTKARQFYEISAHLFSGLKEEDFYALDAVQKNTTAISALETATNNLAYYVADQILAPSTFQARGSMMEFYIAVMKKSVEMNDFHTAGAILAALKSNPIITLTQSREGISDNARNVDYDVSALFNNLESFYKAMLQSEKPVIPYYRAFKSVLGHQESMAMMFSLQQEYKRMHPALPPLNLEQQTILNLGNRRPDDLSAKAASKKAEELKESELTPSSQRKLNIIPDATVHIDEGIKADLQKQKQFASKRIGLEANISSLNQQLNQVINTIATYCQHHWSDDSLHKKRKAALIDIVKNLQDQSGKLNQQYKTGRLTQGAIKDRLEYIQRLIDDKSSVLHIHHDKSDAGDTTAIKYLRELNKITNQLSVIQTEFDTLQKSSKEQGISPQTVPSNNHHH